jgi:putative ABC transport system permease protein
VIGYMISQNVLHRPVRTFITMIAVALEVTLVIIVIGVTSSLLVDSAKRTAGAGADVMVRPPNSSMFLGFTGAPMDVAIDKKLQQLQDVQAVTPVLVQVNSVNSLEMVWGIDPATFTQVSGGFVFYSGRGLQNADDILVDDIYARSHNNVRVGQMLHVLGNDFHVAGIVEHGKGARLMVLLSSLQDKMGASNKATLFFIKCDRSDHSLAALSETEQLLPSYTVTPMKEYVEMFTSSAVPGLSSLRAVMIVIAVSIGFLVIFLSMYTTVNERTREIGVLKSLGASKLYIARIILSETALLCFCGFALGVVLSFVSRVVIRLLFPSLPQALITVDWTVYSGIIAVLGGLLGALYPTWLASRKDPVEALAYE